MYFEVNKKGSKFSKESLFITSPLFPIKYKAIALFCLISYSAIACLQDPQGGIGIVVGLSFAVAVIAIASIWASGYFAPA